jgi:membrane protein EpsK
MSISSIFNIGMTIKHRFYINDSINIFAKLIQLLFIIILIYFFHIFSLLSYAISILLFTIIMLLAGYFISKKIIELEIRIAYFNFLNLIEMSKMGFASLFNNLGMLLYTSSDIIIINILLGASYVGDYGIALQISFLIPMIGTTFSRIFTPYITELISKNRRKKLINSLQDYSLIFSVIIGLIFSIIVVFSSYILYFWLGSKYQYLYLLIILLSIYQLLHQSTVLAFTYITMMNKLKLPSIITFVAGLVNVVLSIFLIKYTNLGIYGAVVATIVTVFFKTVIFNVMYASFLIKINPLTLWFPIIKGLSLAVLYSIVMYTYISSLSISSIWMLLGMIFIFSIIYLSITYFIIFSKNNKIKFILLFKLNKLLRVFR